jgi:N-acetylneuraminate synthase
MRLPDIRSQSLATPNGALRPERLAVRASIFEDLFVLELANNHWGKLERGLKIVSDFSKVVRFNNVRAAIKLQFRDVNSFVHRDHRGREDVRYIKKTLATHLEWDDLRRLTDAVRKASMITMVTPFDETSVDKCVEFGVQILKIASSDIRDWVLIEKVAPWGGWTERATGSLMIAWGAATLWAAV